MEKKTFKDWHLYFGQPVKVYFEDDYGKFTIERKGTLSWSQEHDDCYYVLYETDQNDDFEGCDFDWKLILRPLSDMTEEEKNEYLLIGTDSSTRFEHNARRTQYLLSKGFDLFGLIDAGLAIDKTKLDAQHTTKCVGRFYFNAPK